MSEIVINLECLMAEEKCIVEKIAEKAEKRSASSIFWTPKCGDKYHCVSSYGGVAKCVWGDYDSDKNRLDLNNVFKTKEEAEFEFERLKVFAKLRRLAAKDNLENKIENNEMYELIYSKYNGVRTLPFIVDNNCVCFSHRYMFATEEAAKNAIKEIGEERLKKYWFEVEKDTINIAMNQQNIEKENKAKCWILCSERLPEENGTYLCTLDGELVGQEEPFTGMCGFENGEWDEKDCVIAWQKMPEPFKK